MPNKKLIYSEMKTLKYLKLFEAFESEALSKVLKYVSKKVGSENSNKFLDNLRDLFLGKYDLQLSKISDNDVEYLPAKLAFKIESKGEVSNPYGIYALKFWFSLTKGYVGVTAVGNTTEKFHGVFSESEIQHLKDNGLKTGLLTPVNFYTDLKHGDEVVGVFAGNEDSTYALSKARIFIEDDILFAIQDVSDGGSPNDRSWRNWGTKSWNLGSASSPDNDHHKLHKYTPSDEPLKVDDDMFGEKFLDRRGYISGNTSSRWINVNDLKDVDFAVVIYFDGLIKDESVSDIKKIRTKEKEGATALLSNEQIKKLNYQRYFNKMIEMYGLTPESGESDIKNLQNMVKNLVAGELIAFSFYSDDPSLSVIDKITYDIRSLFNESDKQYYLDSLSNRYKSGRDVSESYKKIYTASFERVKNSGDEKTLKFFNKLMEISKLIYTKIKESKVESVGDLMILKRNLQSTREFFSEVKSEYFCRGIVRALENFRYNDSDVDRGVELAILESNLDKDMKGLEIFEKFVKQLFS